MLITQDLQTLLPYGIVVLSILFVFVSNSRQKRIEGGGVSSTRWADKEAMSVIEKGIERAQSVLSRAETESLSVVESTKVEMRSFEQEHDKKFEAALEDTERQVRSTIEEGIQEYKNLLIQLQRESRELHTQAQKTIKQHIEETLRAFDKNISDYFSEVEKRGLETIERERAAAYRATEEYKQQRLHFIDEHIVEILERTVALVLKNSLKPEEHMNIILEALERAKAENFFE